MPTGETNAGRFIGFRANDLVAVPAVLSASQAAQLLGFSESDIPVFVSMKLLKPLGKPTQQAPKLFATVVIERLAQDPDWLEKAAQAHYEYWRGKNARKAATASVGNRISEQMAVAA